MSEPKKILIVDDSEENQIFLAQILEDHGYQYQVTGNGQEAMAAMVTNRPDLVLLDVMMPRKSGIFVFKDMKNDPALADIPVIIITGMVDVTGVDPVTGEERPKEDFSDQYQRGMGALLHRKLKGIEPEGFLEKPIDPPLLIEKIKALTEERSSWEGANI